MDSRRTRVLIEIALSVALAAVLAMLTVWRMPQGGSVSLNMLPLFIIALRRGPGAGVAAGALYGGVDFLVNPYIIHWIQPLLDYPVAYGLVGLAGFVSRPVRSALEKARFARAIAWTAIGVVIGGIGRYVAHFISGIVFFGSFAPEGQPVWLYSALYNTYVPVSSAVAFAAAVAILPVLERALPMDADRGARP